MHANHCGGASSLIHFFVCHRCEDKRTPFELDVSIDNLDSQSCPSCSDSLERIFDPRLKRLSINVPNSFRATKQDEINRFVYGDEGQDKTTIEDKLSSGEIVPES